MTNVNIKVLRDFVAVQEMKSTEQQQSIIQIVRNTDDRLKKATVCCRRNREFFTANGKITSN